MSSKLTSNFHFPPFLKATPIDHIAWVAITTVLGLCCAFVNLLIRVLVRAMIRPPFGHDDYIIPGAPVCNPSADLYHLSLGKPLFVTSCQT